MNAREYDPVIARFITPDTIVPGALNSQSYNRYSYVNNNPLSRRDPNGLFSVSIGGISIGSSGISVSLGSIGCLGCDKAADAIHRGGETIQRNIHRAGESVGRALANVVSNLSRVKYVGGLLSTGLLAGSQFGYYYGATTSDWGTVGRAHATGAVLAGGAWAAPGIAAMPWYSSLGASMALGYTSGYSLARINGASSAEAQAAGRDLAKFGFVVSSAGILYNETVGYGATWERGGEAVPRGRLAPPVEGANVIGTVQERVINPNSWFGEGGIISRALNVLPGGNALAGSHDATMAAIEGWGGKPAFYAFNLPMIPVDVVLTAPALVSGPLGMAAYGCGHGGYCDSYQP